MRVIAGQFRSRTLVAPRGMSTRPTSDRLRETLFNVLAPRIEGARFADLYAGSGAVGIEALSRGAASVVFAENAAPAVAAIRENLKALGISNGATVEARGVARALGADEMWDVVFLDPPYEAAREYEATLGALAARHERLLAHGAVVIAEHARKGPTAEAFGVLRRVRLLEQGDAALSFYAISE